MFGRAVAALVMVAGVLLPASSAVAVEDNPSPWTPYNGEDWVTDAGEVCSFAMGGEVVSGKERYRTTAWFPGGSPRYQEWTGQLIVRFTNLDTGESVERNLTDAVTSSTSRTALGP